MCDACAGFLAHTMQNSNFMSRHSDKIADETAN